MRGFLTGVIWGGIVTVLGLAVVSELTLADGRSARQVSTDGVAAAPPKLPEPAAPTPTPEQSAKVPSVATPAAPTPSVEAQGSASVEPPAVPTSEPADESAGDTAPGLQADPLMNLAKPDPAVGSSSEPEIKAVGDVPKMPLALPESDDPSAVLPATKNSQPPIVKSASLPAPVMPDTAATAARISETVDPAASDAAPAQLTPPVTDPAPADVASAPAVAPIIRNPAAEPAAPAPLEQKPDQIAKMDPSPEAAPNAPPPQIPAGMPTADLAPQIDGAPEPAPEAAPEPAPVAEPAAPTAEISNNFTQDDKPSTLAPSPGFKRAVPGVVSNRLPRIGTLTPAESDLAEGADLAVDSTTPLTQFAAVFENPDQKPVIAIVLLDEGLSESDRNLVNTLPFPVSIALDPSDPATPAAAASYRAAGREVVMLATTIPVGAEASDVAVTFQSHADALPEAVAVLDLEQGGFQSNRPLATLVVPVIKDQGRALITWDKGMNAGDQVARREGVASGMVFRRIDPDGSDPAAMRRLLDRAVFKANQSGRAIVVGKASPETIAVLVRWAIEGSGSDLAIGPVTAALSRPQ